MKVLDTVILSSAIGLFIVGVHQVVTVGFQENYFIFMLGTGCLFWYQLRKSKRTQVDEEVSEPQSKKK